MIAITFQLSPSIDLKPLNYATASQMDLRYDGALGDAEICVGNRSLRMVALPLLDLFACLRAVVRALEAGAVREQIESTESEHVLVFERVDAMVRLLEADGPFVAQCPLVELKREVERAADACLSAVMAKRPDLIHNQNFSVWYGPPTTL